jgi:hypothetical protein
MSVAEAAHSGCRIRSARFKDSGFVLHRLHNTTERARASFLRDMRSLVDAAQRDGRPIVGYAVVLWDSDLGSNASLCAGQGSVIPSIAMPEFVKQRLLASKIQDWTAT